jgi:hypothetical protein
MKFSLLIGVVGLFSVQAWAASGHIECSFFHRRPDSKGAYKTVDKELGLKSNPLQDEEQDGDNLGLEGNFSVQGAALPITGYAQSGQIRSLHLTDPATRISAVALTPPSGNMAIVQIILGASKDVYEAQCTAVRNK